jgi:hypothetical protein
VAFFATFLAGAFFATGFLAAFLAAGFFLAVAMIISFNTRLKQWINPFLVVAHRMRATGTSHSLAQA